jgi:hypothetical protein
MKKIVVALLVSGLSLFTSTSQAQTTTPSAPVEYSEKVSVEESNPVALYRQALSWTEGKFPYNPKTDIQTHQETKEISLMGTSKIKLAAANSSGADQEHIVRFNFVFRVSEEGYTYSVGAFRVVPNEKEPTVMVALDDYIKQLSQERANARTRNDRRVTAQATAIASDVASAFRSYMNSQPVVKDGEVGLSDGKDGW